MKFLKKLKSKLEKKNSFLFIIIVILAAVLRFYNLDWDNGQMFHPDERNIANAVVKIPDCQLPDDYGL